MLICGLNVWYLLIDLILFGSSLNIFILIYIYNIMFMVEFGSNIFKLLLSTLRVVFCYLRLKLVFESPKINSYHLWFLL